MPQVKAVFYLPMQDNDGRDLSEEIKDVEFDLFVEFDGWTCQGLITGAYRMEDDTESRDINVSYAVVLDESELPILEETLRRFKRQTTQESIYLEIQRNVDIRFL